MKKLALLSFVLLSGASLHSMEQPGVQGAKKLTCNSREWIDIQASISDLNPRNLAKKLEAYAAAVGSNYSDIYEKYKDYDNQSYTIQNAKRWLAQQKDEWQQLLMQTKETLKNQWPSEEQIKGLEALKEEKKNATLNDLLVLVIGLGYGFIAKHPEVDGKAFFALCTAAIVAGAWGTWNSIHDGYDYLENYFLLEKIKRAKDNSMDGILEKWNPLAHVSEDLRKSIEIQLMNGYCKEKIG